MQTVTGPNCQHTFTDETPAKYRPKPGWRAPRFSLNRLYYPGGLKPAAEHSQKCYDHDRTGRDCICSVLPRTEKALTVAAVLAHKAWKGSKASSEGDFNVIRHPSGAIMRLRVRGA